MVRGDLLDRLAATVRLHGDSDLQLGAVGAALAHQWEPLSGAVPSLMYKRWGLSRKPDHLTLVEQRDGEVLVFM